MKQPGQKVSVEQKQVIIDFMEQNIEFAQGTAISKNRPTYSELWNQLTLLLNTTPGPKKEKIKWQKVWSGIKKGIKTKLKKVQIYQDKKTGFCVFHPKLSTIDERIIAVMKTKTINSVSTLNINNQNSPTVEGSTESKLNIKMKEENLPQKMNLGNLNISTITSIFREPMFLSEDEEYSESTSEECSNFSWNSHDNRTTQVRENNSSATLREKMDRISLQLEQIIEQNSVTNILLQKMATTLERNNI